VAAAAAILGLGAASLGCGLIVGAGDYQVGDGGSSAGQEGGSDLQEAALPDGADDGLPVREDAAPPGSIGDPCGSNNACNQGTCITAGWCTIACTNSASCGVNTAGLPNYCAENANNQNTCFPGCLTDSDCDLFNGATCQPLTATTSICSTSSSGGFIGDPCSTDADCVEGSCESGILWCTQSCVTDADCDGPDSAGNPTYCVINGNNNSICFPGCATNADCAVYGDSSLTCQPEQGNSSKLICAISQ
jgi:hypothetical protein